MDDQDRALRDAFAHAPLADNGFSERVIGRIRRRARLRRWLLPVATAAGLAVAGRALLDLGGVLTTQSGALASALLDGTGGQFLPAAPIVGTTLAALLLLGGALGTLRLFED